MSVYRASSPVFVVETDNHEFFGKRLGVEHASLIDPRDRKVVAMGNATYRSYRLPLRVRAIRRVVWWVASDRRRAIKQLLRKITSIGKKRSIGYGAVAKWDVDQCDIDMSWFAPTEKGTILMRPLPNCDELPADLAGACPDFGAVQPPYWHPQRYVERMIPC
jgi:CRISPR type IV-associated protein Csf3